MVVIIIIIIITIIIIIITIISSSPKWVGGSVHLKKLLLSLSALFHVISLLPHIIDMAKTGAAGKDKQRQALQAKTSKDRCCRQRQAKTSKDKQRQALQAKTGKDKQRQAKTGKDRRCRRTRAKPVLCRSCLQFVTVQPFFPVSCIFTILTISHQFLQ